MVTGAKWRVFLVASIFATLTASSVVADEPADAPTFQASEATAADVPAAADVAEPAAVDPSASHKQVGIIDINAGDLAETTVNCFCLASDGRVLAGCGTSSENGEVRVFEADGAYVETWSVPVMVEAINVRKDDGMVFVAGNGKLIKLAADGNLVNSVDAPHVTELDTDKLREEIIEQRKQMAGIYEQQIKLYEQQADALAEQVKALNTQLAQLEVADAEGGDDAEAEVESATDNAAARQQIEAQIAQAEQQKQVMEQSRDTWKEQVANMTEMTDEQLDAAVESSIQRKRAIASISAVGDTVYFACSDSVGYGYAVWKCNDEFADGTQIISELRGCCGQMDVQVSADGVYVAENSRHRVARFDSDGKEVGEWGQGATDESDLEGFGSCCNPMNLAFGADGSVYTAEDTTGRIKQYTPDGKLVSHIGHADVVPGCKKVSIGVSADGSQIYMLDITRNQIVRLGKMTDEERAERAEQTAQAAPASEGGSSLVGSLIRVLTGSR